MRGRGGLRWIVGTATLGERAAAILRDEIEHGALANVATASQVWSTHHRDLLVPEATRRLAAEFGGVLDTVLDLLTPPPRSATASSLPPPAAMPDYAADQERQTIEPLPVLRARRSAPLGGAAEIHTRLRNDGPTPAEVGFVWSDLVAEPDGRIHAGCLRLLPGRVRVPPGACVDLAIGLEVPEDARPGLYHALLQATERVGLRALLTFPVGLEC
jgi:enamine deaminase RidA (YjgF/YER057c/UK114 family)